MDFLTKEKVNEGEVQQYYIEESHPAIIPPETFDLVQIEFQKRKVLGKALPVYLQVRLYAENGGFTAVRYGTQQQVPKVIWQCNRKFKARKMLPPISPKNS